MNKAVESFDRLLENALKRPDNFLELVLPELEDPQQAQFEALLKVLEDGNVSAKQLVASLFTEKLGKDGARFLVTKLDLNQPRLFAEIAAIVGEMGCVDASSKLQSAISEDYPSMVLPALRAISMLPPSEQIDELLIAFLLKFNNEKLLAPGIKYLLPCQQRLVPKLVESYGKLDEERKMWVLKFFAETGNEYLIDLFAEELDRAPLETGLYCVAGLGRIQSDRAVEILARYLTNPEWFLRKRIVEALGQTGRACAIDHLLAMLNDRSAQVQAAAVESLSKVGNLDADKLVKKMADSNQREKVNLIRAMGQLKNEKFVQPLIDNLKEQNMLFFTIDALGDLGCDKACAPLIRLLGHSIWFNRLNALEALVKLKTENIRQLAQEAMNDENDMVRNAAARILDSVQN